LICSHAVAALSGAAKTINQCGGFETSYTGNIMTSQVQLLDVPEPEVACHVIQQHERDLIEYGNQFCATMKQRGGGLKSITTRVFFLLRDFSSYSFFFLFLLFIFIYLFIF
jgi:hydroxymethylglutaryl-CoA reductase